MLDNALSQIAHETLMPNDAFIQALKWQREIRDALGNLSTCVYPQGASSIGLTNLNLVTKRYDLDFITELEAPLAGSYSTILLKFLERLWLLSQSWQGTMETREKCISISLENFKIDIVPAFRCHTPTPREICLTKTKHWGNDSILLANKANPWAFTRWLPIRLPDAQAFITFFEDKGADLPTSSYMSSRKTALAALKYWLDYSYKVELGASKPPTFILIYLACSLLPKRMSTSGSEAIEISSRVIRYLRKLKPKKLHLVNPVSQDVILTDRWPKNMRDQDTLICKLSEFRESCLNSPLRLIDSIKSNVRDE